MKYLPEIHRSLPSSEDAEKGVLGSALLSPDKVIPMLLHSEMDETAFHAPSNARIWASLMEMRKEDKPIDLITVTAYLENHHTLEEVGGAYYLTELFSFVPTASNVLYYFEILKEKKLLRDLIAAGTEYASRAYEEQGEAEVLVREADAAFTKITESLQRQTSVSREHLLMDYLDEKEKIATGDKIHQFLPSPLRAINERVGGYGVGEVTIIMGPTNSGKSLLGMEHVMLGCCELGHPSAIFTGEMPYRQYMDRITSNQAEISNKHLRFAKLDGAENRRFLSLQDKLAKLPLEIYDQKRNKLTLDSIEAEIRVQKKKMGLKIVLIDYLQKLNLSRRKEMRRDEEVTLATSIFKSLAVELDLWIFVLSATNDAGQVRDSRGPEYDADNIISVITDEEKVTRKVFIPKWRDGEKSYFIDVEIKGDFCKFQQALIQKQ